MSVAEYRIKSIKSMAGVIKNEVQKGNPMTQSFETLIEWIEEMEEMIIRKNAAREKDNGNI